MILGGPVFTAAQDPDAWAQAVLDAGYRAAYCPIPPDSSNDVIATYAGAARRAGIVIAEVGAWSNPISPDELTRRAALEQCKNALQLAEKIGARCCVNIAGSRGERWDGPSPDNLTEDTFGLIVDSVREIVDAVHPRRTFYTLETMPWIFPESPESYLRLLRAIDRQAFAVHLDPVNLIHSPPRYFENAALIRECFRLLGPYIKSCHAKDILLADRLTVHLDEVRPGCGGLDYRVFLRELSKLDPETPVMLEHLPDEAEYRKAAEHLRQVAREEGLEWA